MPRFLPRWVDWLAIGAASSAMLAWTWRTWPDPLVDFGRELYVPWQITMGRMLYRDLAWLNGPLSPYLNAAWMRVFGVSLTSIVSANLVIIAVVLVLLYRLLDAAADRLTAVVGSLVFIALSGFGRLLENGNYNFVCPYSHEITHGFVFSLGALACLHLPRVLRTRNVAAAGILLGVVFLTKVEVAAACALAVVAGSGLRVLQQPASSRFRIAAALFGAAITPPLIAFALLCARLPAAMALQSTFGSLYWTLFSNVTSSPFYRSGLGVDHLHANLVQMLTGAALVCAAAVLATAAGFLAPRMTATRHSKPAAVIAFVATLGLSALTVRSPLWFDSVPKALPLAMLLLVLGWLVAYHRQPSPSELSRVLALRLAISLFALLLLGKMAFNTRLYHYGFALAIPAVVLVLAVFLSWGPSIPASQNFDGNVMRAVGIALAVVFLFLYITAMILPLRDQRYAVSGGSDRFLADARGAAVQASLQLVENAVPTGATLAVLPEGAMINYLSRRSNSTRHITLMPPELIVFGEDRVLRDFQDHPPDFVLLCHKDTSEYGPPLFGHDYAVGLAAWIRANYQEVGLIGYRPLEDPDRFGMLLLQHRSPELGALPVK